jgi:hypothetical protein
MASLVNGLFTSYVHFFSPLFNLIIPIQKLGAYFRQIGIKTMHCWFYHLTNLQGFYASKLGNYKTHRTWGSIDEKNSNSGSIINEPCWLWWFEFRFRK